MLFKLQLVIAGVGSVNGWHEGASGIDNRMGRGKGMLFKLQLVSAGVGSVNGRHEGASGIDNSMGRGKGTLFKLQLVIAGVGMDPGHRFAPPRAGVSRPSGPQGAVGKWGGQALPIPGAGVHRPQRGQRFQPRAEGALATDALGPGNHPQPRAL